jgi:uncharacterized delta-60 repeat protein
MYHSMNHARTRGIWLLSLLALALGLLTVLGPAVARAAGPGTLDPTFGTSGIAAAGSNIRLFGTAVQSNGDLVAVGVSNPTNGPDVVLERFTTSGALDPSFGTGGVVHGPTVTGSLGAGSLGRAVAIQSSGQIVVVGSSTSPDGSATSGIVVERFNANGSLDTSFGSGGVVNALGSQSGVGDGVALQSNGQILATGSAVANGSNGFAPRLAVVRLNTNGSLDTSFGSGGADVLDLGAYSVANAAAVQSNGAIVVVGSQSPGLQAQKALIARLTSTGALDPSFATGGATAPQYAIDAGNSGFNAVAIQPNGSIVAAGAAAFGNTGAQTIVARFTSAGAADTSFGTGGVVRATSAVDASFLGAVPGATGVGVASNGDVIAGGTSSNAGLTSVALWAFTPAGAPDGTFGTSGVTTTGVGTYINGEANALAIGPSPGQQIYLAGDSSTPAGSYSGIVLRYSGFGTPPPPAKLQGSLTGVQGTYAIATVLKQGLKFGVACNIACTVKDALTISAGTAKQLKIAAKTVKKCTKHKGKKRCFKTKVYKPVTLASKSGSLKQAGTLTLTLKINPRYNQALNKYFKPKKQKSIKVNLQAKVSSSSPKGSQTLKKTVKFTG